MHILKNKFIIGGLAAIVLMVLLLFIAPQFAFAGGIAKVIVSMVVSAVVGVVVGIVTANPGAGMAVAMMVCVAICAPGNDGGGGRGGPGGRDRDIPPVAAIPAPTPSTVPTPGPTPSPSPSSPSGALPSASLSRCNATEDADNCSSSSSGWDVGDITIITGHEIKLRWTSGNASSCDGTNFSTGGATSNVAGVNPTTLPTATSPVTYTVVCNDNDTSTAPGSSSVTVTANDVAPTLSATAETIRTGEDIELTWNLNGNNPNTCSFTSGASAPSTATVVSATEATIEALGTSTYTLTCAGGSDTLTIQVTPQVYES